jgi:hypothetical protein
LRQLQPRLDRAGQFIAEIGDPPADERQSVVIRWGGREAAGRRQLGEEIRAAIARGDQRLGKGR